MRPPTNVVRFLVAAAALLVVGVARGQEAGEWKTAYFKRGFVGNAQAGWVGGVNATLRMPVPIPFAGTQVRVFARGCFDVETVLTKMTLVRGVNAEGRIGGPQHPVLFQGESSLTLAKRFQEAVSDVLEAPVTAGVWYVQDSYASQNYPYAYDVDRAFYGKGDQFEAETLTDTTTHSGVVYRIDVFTTDPRPTVVCYGDSITHGFGATPNAGRRYPDVLSRLLDRPTLNLGVNGDLITQTRGTPTLGTAALLKSLEGVNTMILLMGINDIISNPKFTRQEYANRARHIIDGCREHGLQVFIGTIPPGAGFKEFDADPAKESLRGEINTWIRTASQADGVIDFDSALADPNNPGKFAPEWHCGDWLHPNDAGYKVMAEAAAAVIAGNP